MTKASSKKKCVEMAFLQNPKRDRISFHSIILKKKRSPQYKIKRRRIEGRTAEKREQEKRSPMKKRTRTLNVPKPMAAPHARKGKEKGVYF